MDFRAFGRIEHVLPDQVGPMYERSNQPFDGLPNRTSHFTLPSVRCTLASCLALRCITTINAHAQCVNSLCTQHYPSQEGLRGCVDVRVVPAIRAEAWFQDWAVWRNFGHFG